MRWFGMRRVSTVCFSYFLKFGGGIVSGIGFRWGKTILGRGRDLTAPRYRTAQSNIVTAKYPLTLRYCKLIVFPIALQHFQTGFHINPQA